MNGTELRIGNLCIAGSQVFFHGVAVEMTTQERHLLTILASEHGAIIHRGDLLEALYGDFEIPAEPKILDVLICRVRKKLAKVAQRHCIETLPGTGYRYSIDQTDITAKEDTVSKTFHHKMMRELDGATYRGEYIPPHVHHAMRQALRKANMRGAAIDSPKALAKATLAELARR